MPADLAAHRPSPSSGESSKSPFVEDQILTSLVHSFLGFVFALNHLCDGAYSIPRIAEWLIFIWFGLDGTGLEKSPKFHPLLGPGLITVYAALSNTLLVSLLVSILSTTYSQIAADAVSRLARVEWSALTSILLAGCRGHVPQGRADVRGRQIGLAF